MLTAEQKFNRLDGIGASEIPVILGVADKSWKGKSYRTPEDILAVKTGQAEEVQEADGPIDWGNRLEPLIADWYVEKYGGLATKSDAIWSPEIPFAFCTPDRIIDRGQLKHGLEIKNKGYSQKGKWKEGPPESVLAQVKWSMMVTGWDRWDIAVLINGNDSRAYTILRDREWEKNAIAKAVRFWEQVQEAKRKLWG